MRKWAGQRRQDLRDLVTRFKAHLGFQCARCHRIKDQTAPATLRFDWHHIDPSTKSFEINDAVNKRRGPVEIAMELLKCVYVCEECHRQIHREIDGWR